MTYLPGHLKMKITPATNDQWDRTWEACEYATYFHSRQWAKLWQAHSQGRMKPAPQQITFSDGARALLPLTISTKGRGLINMYLSSPAGGYGGWLSGDQLNQAHGELLMDHMQRTMPNLFWRINPFDDAQVALADGRFEEDQTHVLNLAAGFDAILKGWSSGSNATMRKVRKARRAGAIVRRGEGEADWREFYEMYRASVLRWGDRASSSYDWRLLELLSKEPPANVQLWLCELEQTLACGAVCLSSPSHVAYWLGAAHEKFFKHRPVNLLMHEIVSDACDRGCTWFDFNPSGGHEGVEAFKRSFGAVSLACPQIHRQNAILRTWKSLRGVRGGRSIRGQAA